MPWSDGTYWNLSKKPITEGSSYAVPHQPAKPAATICANWDASVSELGLPTPLHGLWDTLQAKAAILDALLSGGGDQAPRRRQKHRTMLHGDYKAENILFKAGGSSSAAGGGSQCAVVDWNGGRSVAVACTTPLEILLMCPHSYIHIA